jgi:hypothetical protein
VQGRDLVAQGFASARGHQDKGVLAADQPFDDLLLGKPEGVIPEDFFQTFKWGSMGKNFSVASLFQILL